MQSIDHEEITRLFHMSQFERAFFSQGFKIIAGVDEAGRGPLAGPVVAAACILPESCLLAGLNDSKQVSSLRREALFDEITSYPGVYFALGVVSAQRIDEINILQATMEAMQSAVANLFCVPDLILVDGNRAPSFGIPAKTLVKGDTLSVSIAAASILAKVTRDRWIDQSAEEFPQYGFKRHKGYGTAEHLEALRRFGPCPLHRMTFEPIKSYVCAHK
jgi:ribonuclease HII